MTLESAVVAASWISFWSALVPLGWLAANRMNVDAPYWIVGVAWVTAVGQDSQALLDGGTWLNTYLWPALTFSLLAFAVVERKIMAWAAAGVFWFLAWLGMHGAMDFPDPVVPFVGSAVVVWSVWGKDHVLRRPLLVYCGIGTPLYVGYALTTQWYWVATSFWLAYKAASFVAFGLFIAVAHREASRA